MKLTFSNLIVFTNINDQTEFFVCDFHLSFKFDLPYKITYTPRFKLVQHFLANSTVFYYAPYLVLQLITFLGSFVLIIASFKVVSDILYISKAVSRTETFDIRRKPIVLGFNHCRFISKSTFTKKAPRTSRLSSTLEHLKSLNNSFFVSLLHYALHLVLFVVTLTDILTTGMISELQIYLIGAGVFLGCADVATIYVHNSHYNLLKVLFDQYSAKLLYFTAGSVMVFYIMTFIFTTFYGYTSYFSSLTDSANALLALMLGDSVNDIFNAIDDNLGIVLTSVFMLVFHLSLIQIFMGLMASGFQRAKADFNKVEQAKAVKVKNLLKRAKNGLKLYKTQNDIEIDLKHEFEQKYVDKLAKTTDLKSNMNRNVTTDQKFRTQIPNLFSQNWDLTNRQTLPRLYPPSLNNISDINNTIPDTSTTNEGFGVQITNEINQFIVKRFRKRSEGNIHIDYFKNEPVISDIDLLKNMTPIDKAIKSLTFEVAILIKYNFHLLKKCFTEFSYIRNTEKFSFILVIASAELCDNFLANLDLLRKKIEKIRPKTKPSSKKGSIVNE